MGHLNACSRFRGQEESATINVLAVTREGGNQATSNQATRKTLTQIIPEFFSGCEIWSKTKLSPLKKSRNILDLDLFGEQQSSSLGGRGGKAGPGLRASWSKLNGEGGTGGGQGATMGCGASSTTAVDPLGQDSISSLSQLDPAPGAVLPPSIRLQSVGQSRVRALWGFERRGARQDGATSPLAALSRFSASATLSGGDENMYENMQGVRGEGGEEAEAPVFMLEVDAGAGKGFERVYVGGEEQV